MSKLSKNFMNLKQKELLNLLKLIDLFVKQMKKTF